MGVALHGREFGANSSGRWTQDTVRKRELKLGIMELSGRITLAVLRGNYGGPDDLDRAISGSVTASHIIIQSVNGITDVGISVFAVHIVNTASGAILQPETIVLHVSGILLGNLIDIKDLSSGLFHLSHLMHEVPKSGTGENFIAGK